MRLKTKSDTEDGKSKVAFKTKLLIGLLIFGVVLISVVALALVLGKLLYGDISVGAILTIFWPMIFIMTLCIIVFVADKYVKQLTHRKPTEKNIIAQQEWISKEQMKEFTEFAVADIDFETNLKIGGYPITTFIDDNVMKILYDAGNLHTITIGTTRSGKSRKIVLILALLIAKAGESMVFNDPKKELYYQLSQLLKNEFGYTIISLDFRFFQFSDGWNPLDLINDIYEDNTQSWDMRESLIDTAAKDFANVIMELNGTTEPIWVNGERSVHQSALLATLLSGIPRKYKNIETVTQTVELNQSNKIKVNGKTGEIPLYNLFLMSLPEDHPARRSGNLLLGAPADTRDSFYSSAIATYDVFHSKPLLRVLNKSDFSFKDFADPNKKIAIFVTNPDEKATYDRITSVFFDQIYQSLVDIANKLPGQCLPRNVHQILDEFGNMGKIDMLSRKLTVSLSRGLRYHLFLQDFAQVAQTYEDKIAKIVRSNCMVQTFISSTDTDTCKEISERLGEKDELVASYSSSHDNIKYNGGSISYQHQKVPLMDTNTLLNYDARNGKDLILHRTYLGPMKVDLPDISQYSLWSKAIKENTGTLAKEMVRDIEESREDIQWVIPRYVLIKKTDLFANDVVMASPDIDFANISKKMAPPKDQGVHLEDMVWYWSNSTNIGEQVKEHLISWAKEQNTKITNEDLNRYAREDLNFLKWVDQLDIQEASRRQKHKKNSDNPKFQYKITAEEIENLKKVCESFDLDTDFYK